MAAANSSSVPGPPGGKMSGLFAYDLVSLAHPGDIVSVSQAGDTVGGRDSTAMLDLRRLRTGHQCLLLDQSTPGHLRPAAAAEPSKS